MSFEDVELRIEATERRWRIANAIFPESLATWLFDIEWAREQREHREQAATEFEKHIDELRRLRDQLESDKTALQERSFDDSETTDLKISIRLDQANERLTPIQQIDTDYLYTEEIREIESIADTVDQVGTWLDLYENVGTYMDAAERKIERFDEKAEPYLEYQIYLTSEARDTLTELLDEAEEAITNGFDAAKETPLAAEYLDRLTELKTEFEDHRRFVATYNETFFAKESDRHEDLFTDIDEEGNDLSSEQRKAVLRDDKYNLVVAGAGSGKTVALTHRVAYLTKRRNSVPPERILAISYTNNAADVMGKRLQSKFGINTVETTTFHALGRRILETEWDVEPEVFLERDRRNLVERIINRETDQSASEFKEWYFEFLKHFYDDVEKSAEFEEKEESVAETQQDARLSLKQETVRSAAEKTIADFLFLHQIEYEYRSLQEWVEDAPGRGTYRADFYLPEYDLILSHRPIRADGTMPDWSPYSSFEDLKTTVQWEQTRFNDTDPDQLIETYEFEEETGRLEQALRARLIDAGVVLDELTYEEFVETAFDYSAIESEIMSIFSSFINNARQLNHSPDDLHQRIANESVKKHAFGQCASIMYREYCDHLDTHEYVDFPGMLYQAIDAIENDPVKYQEKYDQILVDEFQDVSRSKVELIQQFVTPENDTTLFCVGDDWQSIYSFSGSDVSYFLDFEEYFASPQETMLTANYRCPETVVKAGNTLIRNNEQQKEKTAVSATDTDTEVITHSLAESPGDFNYNTALCERIVQLIERYLASGTSPNEIMILARAKSFYSELEELCSKRGIKTTQKAEDEDDPEEFVRLYSVHRSKGDEADHVIIIHAVEDLIGFPSQVENEELLEPVRIAPEENIAEERRLFYVALTRSSETLDIVTSDGHESRFLTEIDQYLSEPSNIDTLDEADDRIHIDRVWLEQSFGAADSQAQAGILSDGLGTCRFVIWEDNEITPLTDGVVYELDNGRVAYNDYREEYEIHFDRSTAVKPIDDRG